MISDEDIEVWGTWERREELHLKQKANGTYPKPLVKSLVSLPHLVGRDILSLTAREVDDINRLKGDSK